MGDENVEVLYNYVLICTWYQVTMYRKLVEFHTEYQGLLLLDFYPNFYSNK